MMMFEVPASSHCAPVPWTPTQVKGPKFSYESHGYLKRPVLLLRLAVLWIFKYAGGVGVAHIEF